MVGPCISGFVANGNSCVIDNFFFSLSGFVSVLVSSGSLQMLIMVALITVCFSQVLSPWWDLVSLGSLQMVTVVSLITVFFSQVLSLSLFLRVCCKC